MRPYSHHSARHIAIRCVRRGVAIIKAAALTAWFAAAILCGVARMARCQNALSFVTSNGVQLYDLTYVTSVDWVPHLFPGTPTNLPSGPLGVVVFSATVDDPTLLGQSFQNVFGVSELDIEGKIEDWQLSTLNSTFIASLRNNYVLTDPNTGNPTDTVTGNGYLFSNGQDIGTIIFDPPVSISVFGLAAENSSVPEPGSVAVAVAAGLSGIWLAVKRRTKRFAR